MFLFFDTVSITDRSYGGSYLCPLCCGLCCLVCAIMCSQLLTCKVSILEQTDFYSLQTIMLQYVPRIQFTVLPLCCMLNLSLVLDQFSLPLCCMLNLSLVLDQFSLPQGCVLNLSLVLDQFSLPQGCVLNLSLVLDQFTVCHYVVC